MFLKISSFEGVIRFGKREKLSPRYIGPFEILRRQGAVAYELALPLELSGVHPVFHVSMLRKYLPDESHVLQPQAVEVDSQMLCRRTHSRSRPASSKTSFVRNSFDEGYFEPS